MSTYVTHKNPAVTLAPTVKGGVGAKALRKFYETEFIPALPPSMRLRLLSRTVGSDRVVDELHVTFDHTVEMPWMLPGVPPTHKKVEMIIVCIVSLKAGKLFTEHMYWDQASVLMQVGLLDPKLVPDGVKGVKSLPVSGREAARRILGEHPARGEEYHQNLVASAKASAASRKPRTSKIEVDKGKGKAIADRQSKGHSSETASGVDGKPPKITNGSGKEPPKASGEATGKATTTTLDGNSGGNGLLGHESETNSHKSMKQTGSQPTDQESHIASGNGGVNDDDVADDEITDAQADNHHDDNDEKKPTDETAPSQRERPSMAARVDSAPPEDDE